MDTGAYLKLRIAAAGTRGCGFKANRIFADISKYLRPGDSKLALYLASQDGLWRDRGYLRGMFMTVAKVSGDYQTLQVNERHLLPSNPGFPYREYVMAVSSL